MISQVHTQYMNKDNIEILLISINILHLMFPESYGSFEKNKKRDIRDWYQSNEKYHEERIDLRNNANRRGDIPILHGDCDENLAKSLAELMALVKLLRDEVKAQRGEIQYLRGLIENCAGCQKAPEPITRDNCKYSNPCFPGMIPCDD